MIIGIIMNTKIKYGLSVLTAVFLFAGVSALAQNKVVVSSSEQAAYERVMAVSKSLKSLTCDFTETKNMAVLAAPVVKKGRLSFAAPDCMRWEYDLNNYGVCNSSGAYMIKNGKINNGASRAFAMIGKITTSFISGKPVDTKQFSMSSRMEKGDFVVILKPLSDRLKAVLDYITMRFDPKSGLIKSYETHRGEDYTRLIFNNIKINIDIDRQLFN